MRLNIYLFLPSILACSLAHADDRMVRPQIERQYKSWATATLTNNVDRVLAILAPDYTLQTFTGKVITRKMYEQSLRKRKAENKPASAYTTRMKSINVVGATATVVSEELSKSPAVDPITNERQILVHIHEYNDTWVRIAGVWRLRSTVTKLEKTTVEAPH